MPIQVLIADDHALMRSGLKALLERSADIRVVAEASDGREAVALIAQHRPDVVLMDVTMDGLNGLEATVHAVRDHRDVRVIVLSMHNDEPYVIEALRAGAMAYILKGSESTEIARAVAEVIAGRRYLSAPLSERAIAALTNQTPDQADPLNSLTPREREVLALAAEGMNTTEMAEKLFISPRTAETHRTNLMQKLGLQSQTDLVRFAIRRGLIQP